MSRLACCVIVAAAVLGVPPAASAAVADREIAFVSTRDGRFQVYSMRPDGAEQTRVTSSTAFDFRPVWSPNAAELVFASTRETSTADVWRVRADGRGARRLTSDPGFDFRAWWAPDARSILFTSTRDGTPVLNEQGRVVGGQGEIYSMRPDGSQQARLTVDPAFDHRATVSPDGRLIAFDSNRGGSQEIYVMNRDGSGLRQLTSAPASGDHPIWSPNGRRIAFVSTRDGNAEVYSMNADGSDQRNLSRHPGFDNHPDWSPDGREIAFETSRDGNLEVYAMRADGTRQRNLTRSPGSDDAEPDWNARPEIELSRSRSIEVARRRGLSATCFGAQLGTCRLTARAGRRTVARGAARLRPGRTTRVIARVTSSGRRLLAEARRVTLAVRLSAPGERPRTRRITLR